MARGTRHLRRYMGVKPKIFLFMMAFCLLLLGTLWLFQTVLLDAFYTRIKLGEVQRAATSIAAAIEAGGDWQTEVLQRGDLYVELYSEAGSETVPGNRPEGMFATLSREEKQALYAEAVAGGGAVSRRESTNLDDMARELLGQFNAMDPPGERPFGDFPPPEGENGLAREGGAFPFGGTIREERESVLYATLVAHEGDERLLIVSAEITPVNATVQTLQVQLVYISVFVLALGLALAWLISRLVATPITRLNRGAQRLAGEEYDVRFDAGGYREIAQLSDTLNHAAAELGKTEALRRELVANVSHDLRTPLTLITGYAEMIRDIPGEATGENMQVIIDESMRLTGLVNELVDYSRLESGTGEVNIQRVSLTAEVREIIDRFSKLGGAEGFTIEFSHTEDVYVDADPKRLAQVVYNFLSNAVNHTGTDKYILVRQRQRGASVALEVEDTGAGIPAEDLPYIWQRYYKTDGDKRTLAPGSGLGLSIAKAVLDRHPGAEYGAKNGKEHGSVFWFSLPAQPPPP